MFRTNRYLCTVLNELRTTVDALSWVTLPIGKRHISSLVEEVQTLANKMEAGLRDKKDFYRYTKDAGELGMSLKEYVSDLEERKKELSDEKSSLKQQVRSLEFQIPRYLDFHLSQTPHFQIPGFPDSWISRFPDFQIQGCSQR